jgi:hypothetical protein
LVDELGLKIGDSFDASVTEGMITLVPMELYPRPKIQKIIAIVSAADKDKKSYTEVLQNIKELFGSMSGTSMSSEAYAALKQSDMELE